MFSIIIPLYNKAAYIEKAIHSVINQTFQEFEVIVVNDGSTDDSLKNLQFTLHNLQLENRLQFEKIRIIDQRNQGVSTARNNGVKEAKNEYIAFLDADDWWEPTYLEEMSGLIEEYPEAVIYSSSYYLVKINQRRVAPIGIKADFKHGFIDYCQVYAKKLCMPIWTGATIIKRSVFELEDGFATGLKMGEDFDLWIRVVMKYPVVFLNKPLSNYNQDVELANRAIGEKLYKPQEYMLFKDYSNFKLNVGFQILFERLLVYGLINYYLADKNKVEVEGLLASVHWRNVSLKYWLYYKLLPKRVVKVWFDLKKQASQLKTLFLRSIIR